MEDQLKQFLATLPFTSKISKKTLENSKEYQSSNEKKISDIGEKNLRTILHPQKAFGDLCRKQAVAFHKAIKNLSDELRIIFVKWEIFNELMIRNDVYHSEVGSALIENIDSCLSNSSFYLPDETFKNCDTVNHMLKELEQEIKVALEGNARSKLT